MIRVIRVIRVMRVTRDIRVSKVIRRIRVIQTALYVVSPMLMVWHTLGYTHTEPSLEECSRRMYRDDGNALVRRSLYIKAQERLGFRKGPKNAWSLIKAFIISKKRWLGW